MTARIAGAFALASLFCFAVDVQAQFHPPAPPPLAAPDLKVWTGGVVNDIVRDAQGGLIVAGQFLEVNGQPRRHLARILPDGTLDPGFAPEPDFGVQDIEIAPDGTIYVAGSFGVIGGQAHARLARLSPGGAVDATWTPSVQSTPRAIALGDDELYLGGFFATVGGQPRTRLAKVSLSGAGAVDATWTPSASSTVDALAYDPVDDSLFIGGSFISVSGTTRARIAKLDGSGSGALRAWDAPASLDVRALQLDGAGSLYALGGFTVIGADGGAGRQYVARLSTDTGIADSFALTFPQGTDGGVSDMDLRGDVLYLGGSFTHVNGTPRKYAAKVSTLDATLVGEFVPDFEQPLTFVFAPGDGAVYATGTAALYVNGDTRVGLAVVDGATGSTLAPLDVVSPGVVYDMAPLPGGGQIIGGDFYRVGSAARENIAKLLPDGTVDPDWAPTVDGRVRVVAVDAVGNAVYIAGVFDAANDEPRNALAKFSTTGTGALASWDAGIQELAAFEPVRAIAVDPSGDVYVGGAFQQIGGQVRCCIAKLRGDDASLNPAWGAGADAAVTSLGLSPDGFVYVSGPFTQINGQNRDRFARLDGSTGAVDMAFSASLTASQAVASYAFVDDALYISGSFTTVGGVPRNYVARLDAATGAVDAGWAPSANRAVDLVLPAGAAVFLAGDFSSIGGTLRFQLAKVSTLDATLDPDWDPQVYDGSLIAALLDPAGNLLIGGSFRNIGLSPRQGLAAIAPAIPVVVLPPHIFGSGFEN